MSAAEFNNLYSYQNSVRRRLWVSKLRTQGFKAAHPNDGWVDRKEKTIAFAYPHFDDGVQIGDKVMIGEPDKRGRPVRLIGETGRFVKRFMFEDIDVS